MPFLRRRGNAASELNMRQHADAPDTKEPQDDMKIPTNVNHDQDQPDDPSRESEDSVADRPSTPPVQQQTNRHKRFSVLRFRNASDSQLSLKAKQQAEKLPPIPQPPAIITTAPTNDLTGPRKASSRLNLGSRFRRSNDIHRPEPNPANGELSRKSLGDERIRTSFSTIGSSSPRNSRKEPAGSNASGFGPTRQSESSRSDLSSLDTTGLSSPSVTPKKTPSSSIFRLRRAKNTPEPFFPIGHLPQKGRLEPSSTSQSLVSKLSTRPASARSAAPTQTGTDNEYPKAGASTVFNTVSGKSGHSSPTRVSMIRGRSSTLSSLGRDSTDDFLAPPTTRTSTSTGRKSFGDLLGISRLRQNSELTRQGTLTPATPGSIGSQNNSLQLARDTLILPERQDEESAAKYLARLEDMAVMGAIAAALSKSNDQFFLNVLRSYMRKFSFFGDPMDMALRKLLMEAELPKETQQIDRFLQAFANRYHECNPGIYSSPDQAYFIAFSLLILHTDVFNKNNKYKMQKSDYIKNTRGEGIVEDVLECFYDNISYTPFIHVEDDIDISTDRKTNGKSKRKPILPGAANEAARRAAKEPIDPYMLIIDGNLDILRPNLKDAMYLDDPFNYLGTSSSLNMKDLQKTFFRTGVLQIVSARSRPDAFMSEKTATNPQEADPGIVDIKVTKVGLLWRKDAKKRKTRSPWQEWGAILTGAQLYFFRNTSWIKNLMHQYDNHIKAGHDGIPLIFNPPLEEFKPDALMSTNGAVALMDTTYKKHKNAFVYVKQGCLDEVLLADTEDELNDWMAKLNYAAAFRTTGVRMRGLVGGSYDGQGRRGLRRLDSSDASQMIQTPSGPVTIARSKIDRKMVEDIQSARRDIMREKIDECDAKVEECQRQLDEQLRNARHLQILAPVQPRSRDQLLSAAARMSAQLKWTRMEIWKEKCHRDILRQDLAEDAIPVGLSASASNSAAATDETPTTPTLANIASPVPASPAHGGSDRRLSTSTESPKGIKSPSCTTGEKEAVGDAEADQGGNADVEEELDLPHDIVTTPKASKHQSKVGTEDDERPASNSSNHLDEYDAKERALLRRSGVLEGSPTDKTSATNEASETGTGQDRDKGDRTKVRRSLHRTLRESAGHLSSHRSKRGKDGTSTATDETTKDSTLARGTGSFVVHGKKASVINLGTEISSMTRDDKLATWKQQHQAEAAPTSPNLSITGDEAFTSALEIETAETKRRESQASASTATAMSFRELHRKYSSAQAARHVSAGGRLTVPSDGDSDIAISVTDDRRSSLPPIDNDSEGEETSDFDSDEGSVIIVKTAASESSKNGDGDSGEEHSETDDEHDLPPRKNQSGDGTEQSSDEEVGEEVSTMAAPALRAVQV